jgi:DNA-directed RNA polymerase specialized sigma24 family protein
VRRWLFHTAYCRAVDHLRRRKLIRWEPLETATDAVFGGQLPAFEDALAEDEAVRAALATLAPSDAACLLLRVVHGFSAAEVGAIVGAIVGAAPEVVTKRLSRAKQRLRAAYLAQNASMVEERIR